MQKPWVCLENSCLIPRAHSTLVSTMTHEVLPYSDTSLVNESIFLWVICTAYGTHPLGPTAPSRLLTPLSAVLISSSSSKQLTLASVLRIVRRHIGRDGGQLEAVLGPIFNKGLNVLVLKAICLYGTVMPVSLSSCYA